MHMRLQQVHPEATMELRQVSGATSLRCWLISSPALLLSTFFLLQYLLSPDAATSWFRRSLPHSCDAAILGCTSESQWRSRLQIECAVYLILAERGASLLHSWSDEELLLRAGATIASYKEMQLQRTVAPVVGRDLKNVSEPGVVRQVNVTVSRFLMQYQQSAHKEYCKLVYHGPGLADGPTRQLTASASPQTGLEPPGLDLPVRPKVAFLFLTTGWLPFARLWDEFFSGYEHLFNTYVHAWPYPGANQIGRDSKHFWGRFIPSDAAQRATASLIAVARRLLANALLDDPMNEYFALVSDHCIPVRGFQHVYDVLTSSSKSFVQQHSDNLYENGMLWIRYNARGGPDVMLPEVQFSNFRMGSQFWVIIRRHALLFARDTKYWNKFNLPCNDTKTCFPEEHYFPSVLAMEDPDGTVNYTLTAVDWSRANGSHPTTYRKEEVTTELISSLQSDRGGINLFARKFNDDSLDALMALSHDILRN